MLGGVHDHAAPAGANVEQPLAGSQGELAADEVELLGLGLLEGGLRGGEAGAGVRHRGPENDLVEAVRDVVVVGDRRRRRDPSSGGLHVAARGGDSSGGTGGRRRAPGPMPRRIRSRSLQGTERAWASSAWRAAWTSPCSSRRPGHVCAREAQLAGRGDDVSDRLGPPNLQHGLGVGGPGAAAVIGPEADRGALVDHFLEDIR